MKAVIPFLVLKKTEVWIIIFRIFRKFYTCTENNPYVLKKSIK